MGYEKCIAEIQAAAGRSLSDEELTDLLEELQRRTRRKQAEDAISDLDEAVRQAADDYAREMVAAAVIERRNAAINLKRRMEAIDFIQSQFADNPALGIEALLVGVNRPGLGTRASAAAQQAQLKNYYIGGFASDVERLGLFDILTKGELDRDISRALWARDTGGTFTGPREAQQIADVIAKWQEIARQDMNRAGAWVKKLPGYIVRQSHDNYKIRRAGFEAWRDAIMPRLDPARTFDGADPEKFLQRVYENLASGVHLKAIQEGEAPTSLTGPRNIARKASEERVLHFKSADDWFDYNAQFGTGSLREALLRGFDMNAQTTGLMRRLGTNPESALAEIADTFLRRQSDPRARSRFSTYMRGAMRHQLAAIDGTTRIPVNAMAAHISSGTRVFQNTAKLGGALLSQISDIGFYASEMRYQGRNLFQGVGEAVQGLFKGRNRKEMAEIDGMIGVMMDGLVGDITARFSIADDNVPGRLSRLQQLFFKYNGMTWWTDSVRAQASRSMSHRLALVRGDTWDALDPDLRRVLGLYGIDAQRWDVVRSAVTKEADGRQYVVPDTILDLPPERIDPIIADRIKAIEDRETALIAKTREADMRDRERLAKRAGALQEAQRRADAAIEQAAQRRAEMSERARAAADERIALLRAQGDAAKAKADLAAEMATARAEGAARRFLDDVEQGRNAVDVAPRSDAMIGRFGDRRDSIGYRLGERIGNAERRVKEIEAKVRQTERDLAAAERASVERATDRAADAMKAYLDYGKLVDERMTKRRAALEEYQASIGQRIDRIRDETRREIADQLRTYFVDRAEYAVTNPDARTRAIMQRGTQPGTVEGELLRFIGQFKSFPVAVIQKQLGREIYGRGANTIGEALRNGNGELVGLASMIALTTILGYVAMSAKDLAKGRTPRDPSDWKTWTAAIVQGGGAGIYGDFLFGEIRTRFGGGPISTALGPMSNAVEDVLDIMGRMRAGDDASAKAFNTLLSNTPFANLFYMRIVLDYLILYQIKEWLSPGSIRRMEQRIEKENAQTFLVRPSEAVR